MTVAILCNGAFPKKEYPLWLLESADALVCCDGAFSSWARRYNRLPDAVIGDCDSLPESLRSRCSEVLVHDSDEECNDLTKAFRYALGRWKDVSCIHILGAGGRREDHTVGNLSLLMEYEKEYGLSARGIYVDMVSDYTTAFASGGELSFDCGAGRPVSIFCADPGQKIKSAGLQWPTDDVVFDNWWKATLNRSCADTVTLTPSCPSPFLVVLG